MQQRENQRVRRQKETKRFCSWITVLRIPKMLSQKKISKTKYNRNKTTRSMPSITRRALWMRLAKSKTRNLWMSTFRSKHNQTTGKCSWSPLFTLKVEEIPKIFARQRRFIWNQLGKALSTQTITDYSERLYIRWWGQLVSSLRIELSTLDSVPDGLNHFALINPKYMFLILNQFQPFISFPII